MQRPSHFSSCIEDSPAALVLFVPCHSPSFIAKTCSAVYSRAGSVVHMTHGGLVRVMSLHQPVQRSTAALKQSSD